MKQTVFSIYIILIMSVRLSNGATEAAAQDSSLHLMPMPQQIVQGDGKLRIDDSFRAHISGHTERRLQAAAARFLTRLQTKTGVRAPFSLADSLSAQAALEIHCSGAGERIQSPNADESYTLEVNTQGARLEAPSPLGILRGLETLFQLIDRDAQSFFVPFVKIQDRPRFPWRGLHIDVSRHWEPPDTIKQNLDAMAAVKMNVFHWHLSDDQGFRVESRVFPKLHQLGSEGQYYTQDQVREIVAYARDRGIRVIPEFDMPGHATAWLVAYPELASAPGPYQIERSWGVFDPCMDPTSKKTYSFLDTFIGEMAGLFPDQYFHIGGDEVNGKQWNSNPRIRAFKTRKHLKTNRDLQAYFNQRLIKILAKHGKKMIGWDEILHANLPKNITIQSWRGQGFLADSARQGHAGILSHGYYLDHMKSAAFHYDVDPLGNQAAHLNATEKARILGGEACMWAEFVYPDNIESRIWPRTAAIAERLWSPPEQRDVQDMYRRLEYVNNELNSLGLAYQTQYIEMLQRMAGDYPVTPLKTLADLLVPTGLGVRQRTRKYSGLVPLNRMVDVVPPESDTARKFGVLVDNLLAGQSGSTEDFREAQRLLTLWKENENLVQPIIQQSSLLSELDPVSRTVSDLSTKGLQALDYIRARQKPPEDWQKEATLLLQRSENAQAEMLIAIVSPIKKLIDSAGNLP